MGERVKNCSMMGNMEHGAWSRGHLAQADVKWAIPKAGHGYQDASQLKSVMF